MNICVAGKVSYLQKEDHLLLGWKLVTFNHVFDSMGQLGKGVIQRSGSTSASKGCRPPLKGSATAKSRRAQATHGQRWPGTRRCEARQLLVETGLKCAV